MEVRRTALVAHPAERIFALIEAAEDYPAFLPWCAAATILHRDEQVVVARIEVAWRGVRFSFVTRNPKRQPHWMAIGLEEGPFRRFDGQWNLTPLAEWGCRVEFTLVYEFNAALLGTLAGPVFQHVTDTLMDAFVRRADQTAAAASMAAPAPLPPAAPPPPPAPPAPPGPDGPAGPAAAS